MTMIPETQFAGDDAIPPAPPITTTRSDDCARCLHPRGDHQIEAIVGVDLSFGACLQCDCLEYA